MNLTEFKYNDSTYRIRLLSLEIITLDYIKANYKGDILQLDNQYYRLQVYSLNQQGGDVFTTFRDVNRIDDDLWTRTQEVFPGITIVGKNSFPIGITGELVNHIEVAHYEYDKFYNVGGDYVLREHYTPPY